MDTKQYAELFLTESREHVSAMNHWLLELEQNQRTAAAGGEMNGGGATGQSDRFTEAVSAIFRAVHTIKGMSATMGYAAVAELSHELETVLDRVRRADTRVTPELMDLLFRGADFLEQAIESVVEGRSAPVNDILGRLRATAVESAPLTSQPATPPAASAWTVSAPPGPGLLVRVRLTDEAPLRGVRAFLVIQAVRRIGEVIVTSPTLEQLQREEFAHDFALRVRTSTPAVEIERVVRGAGDVAAVQLGDDVAPGGATSTFVRPVVQARPSGVVRASDIPVAEGAVPTPTDMTGSTAGRGDGARQQRNVRIDLRRLDSLMNLIGELVIARGRLQQLTGSATDPALNETVSLASRLIGDLRDEIMTSRMVPVWQVFDRFPRVVRDSARALGKQIDFTIEGKEIELDRSMLDEIGDSIVHLLRNAVDHGLETPDERESAGKPRTGKLLLSAARDRSAVAIRVSDDGRGIDRGKVLLRAKADGLVEPGKTDLSDDELLRLVARPGFSTADRVTDLSGRGVGVDAVYSRVRSLGGAVDMRTVEGLGTTVTLRLPLTLAIIRALLARVAEETYAIPLTHVSETVELSADLHRRLRGRDVLMIRDDVLPLIRLRTLVGLPPEREPAPVAAPPEHVVVIDLGDRRAGVIVDELTGQQEIVVKQFDAVRDGLALFGGATILSDGSPALIMDVSSLL